MSRENIPPELRSRAQWAVANIDKRPYNPVSGRPAKVTDPSTWVSFEAAQAAVEEGRYRFVGIMLTGDVGFVDMDDKPENPATEEQKARFQKIIDYLDSYTERSAGGRGLHVFVRTRIAYPGRQHKEDHVELYCADRFAIMTGAVIDGRTTLHDRTDQLEVLSKELSRAVTCREIDLVEESPIESDQEVIARGLAADNGEKFDLLWRGRWQETSKSTGEPYPSQSEADFALLSMLAFLTRSNEQVRRLFRASGLFRNKKATTLYLNRALRKLRAEMSTSNVDTYVKLTFPNRGTEGEREAIPRPPISMPPGVLGQLAEHFFATAVMPIREVAIAGALAYASGFCGRAYNVIGAGLNLYQVLIAPAGVGKEGARDGIEQMVQLVSAQVSGAGAFLGPERAASGQALHKYLARSPAFVSIWDEFGLLLNQMEAQRAPPYLMELKRTLLTVYTRSGENKVLREGVYADKDNLIPAVTSPALSLLGLTTREHLFDGLSLANMAEGLLPRMSFIEFDGERPRRNRQAGLRPPEDLVARCVEIAHIAVENLQRGSVRHVQVAEDAQVLLDDFEERARVLSGTDLFGAEVMWARSYLKVMKFAALCAVFDAPSAPIIGPIHVRWAQKFVTREIDAMVELARTGTLGVGEHLWEQRIRSTVDAFEKMTAQGRHQHNVKGLLASNPYFPSENGERRLVLPYRIFASYLRQRAPFKGARQGEVQAIRDAIRHAVQLEVLAPAPPDVRAYFGSNTDLYVRGSGW